MGACCKPCREVEVVTKGGNETKVPVGQYIKDAQQSKVSRGTKDAMEPHAAKKDKEKTEKLERKASEKAMKKANQEKKAQSKAAEKERKTQNNNKAADKERKVTKSSPASGLAPEPIADCSGQEPIDKWRHEKVVNFFEFCG